MSIGKNLEETLDLNSLGAVASFDVNDESIASAQIDHLSGQWNAAILEAVQSNDGVSWSPIGTGLISGPAHSASVTVAGVRFVGYRVTTAEGTAGEAHIFLHATQESSIVVVGST